MSVILAVIGGESAAFDDTTIYRALTAMRASADDRVAIWRGAGATLAVARHAWEMSPAFSGDALVVTDGEIAVVADASIYYRDDLRAALARAHVGVTGSSASHLILAAYRAWGADCAAHLEGDFAFVIWDARSHTVVAARDFSGKRTLYYSERGGNGSEKGTLVLASTPGGALALPDANTALNLTVIGGDGGGALGRRRGDVLRGRARAAGRGDAHAHRRRAHASASALESARRVHAQRATLRGGGDRAAQAARARRRASGSTPKATRASG